MPQAPATTMLSCATGCATERPMSDTAVVLQAAATKSSTPPPKARRIPSGRGIRGGRGSSTGCRARTRRRSITKSVPHAITMTVNWLMDWLMVYAHEEGSLLSSLKGTDWQPIKTPDTAARPRAAICGRCEFASECSLFVSRSVCPSRPSGGSSWLANSAEQRGGHGTAIVTSPTMSRNTATALVADAGSSKSATPATKAAPMLNTHCIACAAASPAPATARVTRILPRPQSTPPISPELTHSSSSTLWSTKAATPAERRYPLDSPRVMRVTPFFFPLASLSGINAVPQENMATRLNASPATENAMLFGNSDYE
mmetsp:Transcript_7928/g.17394  ORF Transcript_7928/g.17394 Transcript_7928/m.17394 type:complete len:314 (+) Transcript_7928:180-1121(+)